MDVCEYEYQRAEEEEEGGRHGNRVLERTDKGNIWSAATSWTTFLLFVCAVKKQSSAVLTPWVKPIILYSSCKYLIMCSLNMCRAG